MPGLIFKPTNMPVVPGMVPGVIMENKFRNAIASVDTPIDFLSRFAAAIIVGLKVVLVLAHLRTLWKSRDVAKKFRSTDSC